MNTAALILAGGLGLRMNQEGEPPKQFYMLGEKPILVHTLERFETHPEVNEIFIVCLPTWEEYLSELVTQFSFKKIKCIVPGGALRQESVYNGLCAAECECTADTVIIVHDGVRPFITAEIISQNISIAKNGESAMTGFRSTDSIVASLDGTSADTAMDRDSMFAIQTPQTYRLGYGINLYRKAIAQGIVNSINCCELFIKMGETVHIINGLKTNIKLTTQDDIAYLQFLHTIFKENE
jgi:2-C-methyl-D-erythritol 4-phosphate cytidylyltransferase